MAQCGIVLLLTLTVLKMTSGLSSIFQADCLIETRSLTFLVSMKIWNHTNVGKLTLKLGQVDDGRNNFMGKRMLLCSYSQL